MNGVCCADLGVAGGDAFRAVSTKPLKFRSRKKGRFPIHSYMDVVLKNFTQLSGYSMHSDLNASV